MPTICVPLLLNARVEMLCTPFTTVAEFQLNVKGGEDVRYPPSM
jgi:hypothetical protein